MCRFNDVLRMDNINSHANKESAANELKLRPAHWILFINVELYDNPDYYGYKQVYYYIWSDKSKEFEKYSTTPELLWSDLEIYYNNGLLFVNK